MLVVFNILTMRQGVAVFLVPSCTPAGGSWGVLKPRDWHVQHPLSGACAYWRVDIPDLIGVVPSQQYRR